MDNQLLKNPIILDAQYREPDLPEHKGNPLINSLPPYHNAVDLVGEFGRFPHFSDLERQLPAPTRMLAISRLNTYLEPLPAHFDVIEQIGLIVRGGYVYRNPANNDYRKALIEFYRKSMKGEICPIETSSPSTASSILLIGNSGVGKTTVVERALSFLPQVLNHKHHKLTQVVWIKIDCPLDGSLKQFILTFLDKLDSLLGSDYKKSVGGGTVDELVLAMAKTAAKHYLGLLVIDEIQNLLDASGVGSAKMINFLVTLSNVVKIPLVTIGTPRALKLLDGNFRSARRIGDHGTYIWNSLPFNDEWSFFLNSLWEFQWTVHYANYNDNYQKIMFYHTQGIHALVVRLFQLTQLQAIRDGSECITASLINGVAKDKFALIAPMLNAIRNNKLKQLRNYDDLLQKTILQCTNDIDNDGKLALLKDNRSSIKDISAERLRAISAIMALGYEQQLVQEIVTNIFDEDPSLTSSSVVKRFLDSLKNGPTHNNPPMGPNLNEIVQLSKESGIKAVDALKAAGYIKSLPCEESA